MHLYVTFSVDSCNWPAIVRHKPFAHNASLVCSLCHNNQRYRCIHLEAVAQVPACQAKVKNVLQTLEETMTDDLQSLLMEEGTPTGDGDCLTEASISQFRVPFNATPASGHRLRWTLMLAQQRLQDQLNYHYANNCSQCSHQFDTTCTHTEILTVSNVYTSFGCCHDVKLFQTECCQCQTVNNPLQDIHSDVFVANHHHAFSVELMYDVCQHFISGQSLSSIVESIASTYMREVPNSPTMNLHNHPPTKRQLLLGFWCFLNAMAFPDEIFECVDCGSGNNVEVFVLDACTCGSKRQTAQQQATIKQMESAEEQMYMELFPDANVSKQSGFASNGLRMCYLVTKPAMKAFRRSFSVLLQDLVVLLNVSKMSTSPGSMLYQSELIARVESQISEVRKSSQAQEVSRGIRTISRFVNWVLDRAQACCSQLCSVAGMQSTVQTNEQHNLQVVYATSSSWVFHTSAWRSIATVLDCLLAPGVTFGLVDGQVAQVIACLSAILQSAAAMQEHCNSSVGFSSNTRLNTLVVHSESSNTAGSSTDFVICPSSSCLCYQRVNLKPIQELNTCNQYLSALLMQTASPLESTASPSTDRQVVIEFEIVLFLRLVYNHLLQVIVDVSHFQTLQYRSAAASGSNTTGSDCKPQSLNLSEHVDLARGWHSSPTLRFSTTISARNPPNSGMNRESFRKHVLVCISLHVRTFQRCGFQLVCALVMLLLLYDIYSSNALLRSPRREGRSNCTMSTSTW